MLSSAGPASAASVSAARSAILSSAGDAVCYRVAATVKVGDVPEAAAVDPVTNRIYEVNFGGKAHGYHGTLRVISGKTNRVLKTIRVGLGADGVAVNSETNRIYVTDDFGSAASVKDGTVSVISGRTLRVIATVRVGINPQDVAINGKTGAVYVTNFVNGTISVIRGRKPHVTATFGSGGGPDGIAFNPATGLLYVVDNAGAESNSVVVINPKNENVVGSIPLSASPGPIALDRTTNRIYVTSRDGSVVWVISGQSNSVIDTITVGTGPFGVAVMPRIHTLFVASSGSVSATHGSLSVIDAQSDTVTSTLAVGRAPDDVAANWKTGRVYVVNSGSGTRSQAGSVAVLAPCPG